jgi:hypothetical protein
VVAVSALHHAGLEGFRSAVLAGIGRSPEALSEMAAFTMRQAEVLRAAAQVAICKSFCEKGLELAGAVQPAAGGGPIAGAPASPLA